MPSPLINATLLETLYRRANAGRWQLPLERFARALEASTTKAFGGRTAPARDVERYLVSLHLEELALACACAEADEAAWEHFVLEYRPILYRAANALDPSGGARDLADSLYADLYGLRGPEEARGSLFHYFHGRSSLATWLRALLAQRQVDRVRADRRLAPLPEQEPAAPASSLADSDRSRYAVIIETALGRAVAALGPTDRLRLRCYYVQSLTLAQIGRLLGEHEATVSRQLAKARRALRRDVERQLREQGLNPDQIDECFACVTDDPGPLDLDRVLADRAGAARHADPIVLSEKVKP